MEEYSNDNVQESSVHLDIAALLDKKGSHDLNASTARSVATSNVPPPKAGIVHVVTFDDDASDAISTLEERFQHSLRLSDESD